MSVLACVASFESHGPMWRSERAEVGAGPWHGRRFLRDFFPPTGVLCAHSHRYPPVASDSADGAASVRAPS
jgi:hypothetical protein